jgi:HTH-type transcriptional regulator, glycine betaine synthesis regulator
MSVASESIQTTELELEAIDYFVRFMSLLGMPRSVGEIYGLLYVSPNPLSMDLIVTKLGISIGSASQGLRTLRSLKAVKVTYVLGDRRDYYLAESEFRHLLSTFIKEEIMPHLESGKERIECMEKILGRESEKYDEDFCRHRIEKLKRLQKASSRLLPTLAGLLKL